MNKRQRLSPLFYPVRTKQKKKLFTIHNSRKDSTVRLLSQWLHHLLFIYLFKKETPTSSCPPPKMLPKESDRVES